MNPKLEACALTKEQKHRALMETRAYFLRQYCETHGWGLSWAEAQEAMGWSRDVLSAVIRHKGWHGRMGDDKDARQRHGRRAAALSGRALGRRFDENVLDLVELMGA